jgi:hypothetical protein
LQAALRVHRNRFSRHYRMKSEVGKLRTQVQMLKEALRQRDAWLFRATVMLKRYSKENKISEFLKNIPS